jgi:RNA polymerase sigma factor (sigma-70 family)
MTQEISNEQAKELFTHYSTYVYRVALLLTRSGALADDVVQETFLRIFKSYQTYDPAKPIEPWIYRITVNMARNLMRKQKWLSFVGFAPSVADGKTVESAIIQDIENSELWKEINKLPLKIREIVIMHYYIGLKINEIAESLQIPLGTCKSRIHTALSKLRKQIPNNPMFNSVKEERFYEIR